MLRSVFTTFYRVRVWRCSSPWLSLYAVSPLSFFPLLTIKGAVEGSHLSSVLLYSRQKWDVSGPITALLTVTDDVCPSENTDKSLKTKPQTVSSSLLFQEIYWSHNGGKSLKISHCAHSGWKSYKKSHFATLTQWTKIIMDEFYWFKGQR